MDHKFTICIDSRISILCYQFLVILSIVSHVASIKLIRRNVLPSGSAVKGFGTCDSSTNHVSGTGECTCAAHKPYFYMDEKHKTVSCYTETKILSITGCAILSTSKLKLDNMFTTHISTNCVVERVGIWDVKTNVNKEMFDGPWNLRWTSELLPIVAGLIKGKYVNKSEVDLGGLLIRVEYDSDCDHYCDLMRFEGSKEHPLKNTEIFPANSKLPTSSSPSSSSAGTIAGAVVGVLLIILIITIGLFLLYKKKKRKRESQPPATTTKRKLSISMIGPIYAEYDSSKTNEPINQENGIQNSNTYESNTESHTESPYDMVEENNYQYAYHNQKDLQLPSVHSTNNETEDTTESFYYAPVVDDRINIEPLPEYATVNKNKQT